MQNRLTTDSSILRRFGSGGVGDNERHRHMFQTPLKARRFFEDRIVQQGDLEGVPLSRNERLMLRWSESEPDSIADPELVDRLAAEIADDAYETKIAGLLARSYAADVGRNSSAKTTGTTRSAC